MKYCFGVDIGGTTVKMGLFEENGNVVDKWEIERIHLRKENQYCQTLRRRSKRRLRNINWIKVRLRESGQGCLHR